MTPLLAIRFAMMTGVLLFGGVAWFLHRTPDWTPPDPAMLDQLIAAARVVWAVAGAGLVFLYLRSRSAASASNLSSVAIVAWALGETLALYGAVVYYLAAVAGWYVAGVIVLALAFVAFPGVRAT